MSPKALRWTGRVLTAYAVLFLVFDVVIKLARAKPVADAFAQMGWPFELAVTVGIVEAVCLVLYLVPATAPIGALLLTGYLGGAIATHVRIGSPLFSHVLFPVYIAAPLWIGLAIRDERLRIFIPTLRRA